MASLLHACQLPTLGVRLSLPRRSRLGGRTARPSHLPPLPRSRRVAAPTVAMARASDELGKGIAEMYDEASGMWESVVGEHIHHGFYDVGDPVTTTDHKAAQIRMIEESLRFAAIPDRNSSFLGVYDAAAYAPPPMARWAATRVVEERGEEELKKGIVELYDELSEIWEML